MNNFKDQAYKLSPPTGRGTGFKLEEGNYDNGHVWRSNRGLVETIQGIVIASSYYYEKSKKQGSCLSIIKNGMQHHRFFEKEYTQKTLVTLAKNFAADVFSNELASAAAHDAEVAAKAIEEAADYMMEYLGLPKDITSVSTIALKEYAANIKAKAGIK
jgi:hypothetical protein